MLPDLFRTLSSPLDPEPTDLEPDLKRLLDIRAVIFDIYGTLIISAAGDISLANEGQRGAFIRQAIEAETELVLPLSITDEDLTSTFLTLINQAQNTRRQDGIEYPEVEIREIWSSLLETIGIRNESPAVVEHIAARYECLTNPVWPMPELEELLSELAEDTRFQMGIVSNAQFYTLAMFPAFLDDQSMDDLGFAKDLQVYSFRMREGKPSTALYETIVSNLSGHGISPDQALFVGNDMRNDIWPASLVGMRTALFAGDERSLRLREDDERISSITPDIIVTELSQLLDCIR